MKRYLDGKEFIASEEIYEALGVLTAQRNPSVSQRIAGILTGLGYERVRRRIEGRNTWGYAPTAPAAE